jgi:hypothetical protein
MRDKVALHRVHAARDRFIKSISESSYHDDPDTSLSVSGERTYETRAKPVQILSQSSPSTSRGVSN